MLPKIEVCCCPDIYKYHSKCQIAVLTDVLRATTSMITALETGAEEIKTVTDIETALYLQHTKDFFACGEREAMKVEGFTYGNSPHEFENETIIGKKLVFSTTNGTYALNQAADCSQIILGAFVNLSAICDYLKKEQKDTIIVCSGRHRKTAIEDTLFAGAVASNLISSGMFAADDDYVFEAITLYKAAQNDLKQFIIGGSPYISSRLNFFKEDIDFCMTTDKYKLVPILNESGLFSRINL